MFLLEVFGMYENMLDTIGFIKNKDPELAEAMQGELNRQRRNIELIASENIVSPEVMAAMGSILTNKYAEGYSGKRYYGGCMYIDEVETLAIKYATELFNCKYANVQPHSGSSANMAVYRALLEKGDEIMGMNLSNTDLVVLSACQSGLGDVNIDGTYGIQRSFKIAGVNSIIMSLWEVDDEATKILMTALYEKLAKGISVKDSFDFAINTVKKTYEKRARSQSKALPKYKRYDSAYYWTSFILLD